MALACALLIAGCVQQLTEPWGGPSMLQWVWNDTYFWPLMVVLAYAALVAVFLVLGALLLPFRTHFGRTLTVLGGLGFIVGFAGSQLYVRYVGSTRFLHPLLDPWAIGGGSVGIALAIGAIVCALTARR